jgi:aminoglycoside phosphotransferase
MEMLAPYAWRRQTIGESGAIVYRLKLPGEPVLFVKSEAETAFAQGPDEAERSPGLGGMDCPARRYETHGNMPAATGC